MKTCGTPPSPLMYATVAEPSGATATPPTLVRSGAGPSMTTPGNARAAAAAAVARSATTTRARTARGRRNGTYGTPGGAGKAGRLGAGAAGGAPRQASTRGDDDPFGASLVTEPADLGGGARVVPAQLAGERAGDARRRAVDDLVRGQEAQPGAPQEHVAHGARLLD